MERLPKLYLRRLEGRVGDIAYQLTRVQFPGCQLPETWAPAINAYRCRDGFVVCVDLAGVDRGSIDLRAEPRRLWIRGQRQVPEPEEAAGPLRQVLAMEIDYGPFARDVALPEEIDPEQVSAEQRNGMLWITLPLLSPD